MSIASCKTYFANIEGFNSCTVYEIMKFCPPPRIKKPKKVNYKKLPALLSQQDKILKLQVTVLLLLGTKKVH